MALAEGALPGAAATAPLAAARLSDRRAAHRVGLLAARPSARPAALTIRPEVLDLLSLSHPEDADAL
jgi:hypothetical protein